MFCDLHTHSTFSDGTFSPTEIVLKAKEIGLDAVALCDHNTVAGLDEFVSAGKKYGVTTVAGIEFSTEYNSKQLHIVGLFIKKENHFVDCRWDAWPFGYRTWYKKIDVRDRLWREHYRSAAVRMNYQTNQQQQQLAEE